jgi:hypothetical protein
MPEAYSFMPDTMSYIKAHYHPILFALMSTCALAELGLTAFLIEAGNENHTWPNARYHSLYVKSTLFYGIPRSQKISTLQLDPLLVQCDMDDVVCDGVCVVDSGWIGALVG